MEWLRSRKEEVYKRQTYFKEFFTGVRDHWMARSYQLLNFTRRTVLITFVLLSNASVIVNVVIFTFLQFIYFVIMCFLRPMENKRDNLVELVNEALFTLFSGGLLYLNKQERWSEALENSYIYGILANSIVILIVMIGISFI